MRTPFNAELPKVVTPMGRGRFRALATAPSQRGGVPMGRGRFRALATAPSQRGGVPPLPKFLGFSCIYGRGNNGEWVF